MAYGDHVWVRRLGYSHHGIDCGDGTVIHFSGEPGRGKGSAAVIRSSMESFAQGGIVRPISYGQRRSPTATVEAARSRLGECGYNLAWNNCEHFARWCCTGSSRSDQARSVGSGAGAALLAPVAAMTSLAALSATGAVTGLSGAGMMSGLATLGGLVGGGAATGPAVLAATPAVVGAGIMHFALRDDPSYDETERSSRSSGRRAATAGAVVGVVGASTAISAAGTAGLSAAGISSGLASIGGLVGGGMAAGVGTLVAAPVVAAAALGVGVYVGTKSIRRVRGSWPSSVTAASLNRVPSPSLP